jgi:TonB family protein
MDVNYPRNKSFNKRFHRLRWLSVVAAIGANVFMFYILALARTKPSLTYPAEHDMMRIVALDLFIPSDFEQAGEKTMPDAVPLPSEPTPVTSIQPVEEIVPSFVADLTEKVPDIRLNLKGLPVVVADSAFLKPTRTMPFVGLEKPLSTRKVDRVPSKIAGAPPRYPLWARRDRLEAVVVLRFIVSEEGIARDIRILDIEGDERFGRLAIEAVAQWRFSPAIKSGRPVPCWCFQKISFRLNR